MKFKKVELTPTLKADDYNEGDIVIATGYIKEVKMVKTKFDDDDTQSVVIVIKDSVDNKDKGIFMNTTSNNNLVEALGEESNIWENKAVRVICNKNNFYRKKQFVIEAIK